MPTHRHFTSIPVRTQDFRLLLSPLITRAVIDGFARDIHMGAEREWSTTLAKHASALPGSTSTPPSKWLVSPTQSHPALSSIAIAPSSAAHAPPQLLTAFTPLAVSLNTYLRALNRLRALAPMGALDGVLDALESGLARSGEALLTYARVWRGDATESEVLRAAGAAYVRVLVPFLRRAIVEGVFGITAYDFDAPKKRAEDATQMGGASRLRDVIRNWESWLEGTSS